MLESFTVAVVAVCCAERRSRVGKAIRAYSGWHYSDCRCATVRAAVTCIIHCNPQMRSSLTFRRLNFAHPEPIPFQHVKAENDHQNTAKESHRAPSSPSSQTLAKGDQDVILPQNSELQ
ncbi:hypothetical protein LIA77_09296 [Sarocladium implicatum]|jgi:hypothetical protein|nr:hypothetical protein LIA77_09296 [Sarocladium implicatum]